MVFYKLFFDFYLLIENCPDTPTNTESSKKNTINPGNCHTKVCRGTAPICPDMPRHHLSLHLGRDSQRIRMFARQSPCFRRSRGHRIDHLPPLCCTLAPRNRLLMAADQKGRVFALPARHGDGANAVVALGSAFSIRKKCPRSQADIRTSIAGSRWPLRTHSVWSR